MSVIDKAKKVVEKVTPEAPPKYVDLGPVWTAPDAESAPNARTAKLATAQALGANLLREANAREEAAARAQRERIERETQWWLDYEQRTGRRMPGRRAS